MGVIFLIILNIGQMGACKMLQKMPDEKKENTEGVFCFGPEKTAYIVILATMLLFITSAILLFRGGAINTAIGIGLLVFSFMIPATSMVLALAVMKVKKANQNGWLNFFIFYYIFYYKHLSAQ